MLFTCLLIVLLNHHALGQESTKFAVDFHWTYINYTWESAQEYQHAIQNKSYIPENNFMVGIKFYHNRLYIAMPRVRLGAPVTLGSVSSAHGAPRQNPLISPFPSWEFQRSGDCSHLLNVQSMEIDKNGTMWVIDGIRSTPKVSGDCASKLVLFDLNKNNTIVRSYMFPEALSKSHGGSLNDIIIDDTDGDFAYISDISSEPGIIIYSRRENKAWKVNTGSTNGIALTPRQPHSNFRTIYYCDNRGLFLNSIQTNFLKYESLVKTGAWKTAVKFVGNRQARTGGLILDNKHDLYYGLIDLFGIGRWNVNKPFNTSRLIDAQKDAIIWPDSFGMDANGNLYILSSRADEYFDINRKINITNVPRFRVLKLHTGANSYLYPN